MTYLTKCFSYCVSQHSGDSKSLQQGLNSIIPHAFGEHISCDISWCGYKQNPTTSKHTAYQMEGIFMENPSKKL